VGVEQKPNGAQCSMPNAHQCSLDLWCHIRLIGVGWRFLPGNEVPNPVDDKVFEAFARQLAETIREQVAEKVAEVLATSGVLEQLSPGGSKGGAAPAGRVAQTRPSQADPRRCQHPGCDLPARARGLCSKHYQRQRYAEKKALFQPDGDQGTPLGSRQNPRPTEKRGGGCCSQEGCDQPNYAKGLCSKHFMQWVRTKKSKA
jgi:hypothetical protein